MIRNDPRKLDMELENICYKMNLNDRLTNLSQLVKILQSVLSNVKIKWAFLNSSPDVICDFVIIGEMYNPKAQEGFRDQFYILLPPFLSLTGLHSFNKVKKISSKILQDYLHDLSLEAIMIPKISFTTWLEELDYSVASETETMEVREVNPMDDNDFEIKTVPKILYGLSFDKNAENYFANDKMLPIFMQNLEKLKNDYDLARSTYTKK